LTEDLHWLGALAMAKKPIADQHEQQDSLNYWRETEGANTSVARKNRWSWTLITTERAPSPRPFQSFFIGLQNAPRFATQFPLSHSSSGL
jgi:hypothetical protein